MSSQISSRLTAYASYVFSNLPARVLEGQGLYNYEELAALVGLKPTHNFRRRVRDLVAGGDLQAIAAFTPRGGIETRFTSVTEPTTQEIPF